ncbi:DUF6111 family protein [Shumkonia mesophila]|uniref:DUF6111 family protein n=1 Tax=Shumkonia mesophila TaxID=2838854 RepID=UPI0029352AC9|nr:DUF6111 family protein [Shumkonia mesophila]
MIRILFQYLFPLILPVAVYLVWTWIARKHRRTAEEPPLWYEGPWFWLIVAGFFLMLAVLGISALTGGGSPEGTYVPPRTENGRIVPGYVE